MGTGSILLGKEVWRRVEVIKKPIIGNEVRQPRLSFTIPAHQDASHNEFEKLTQGRSEFVPQLCYHRTQQRDQFI
jgi:hypothetical protein